MRGVEDEEWQIVYLTCCRLRVIYGAEDRHKTKLTTVRYTVLSTHFTDGILSR